MSLNDRVEAIIKIIQHFSGSYHLNPEESDKLFRKLISQQIEEYARERSMETEGRRTGHIE